MGSVEGQSEKESVVDILDCGCRVGVDCSFWVFAVCHRVCAGVGFGEEPAPALSPIAALATIKKSLRRSNDILEFLARNSVTSYTIVVWNPS